MPNVFIDSNVILYSLDTKAPAKESIAQVWLKTLGRLGMATISRQVINEVYFNLVYKPHLRIPPAVARHVVGPLEEFVGAAATGETMRVAWDLEDRYGVRYWDALLLASANAAGCAYFLSEDLNDGQVYGSVTVLNPFRHAPEDVLGPPA